MGGYEEQFGLHGRAFEPAQGGARAPLRPEEVEPYLVERLRAAGWQGTPMLDLGLAPLLHEATGGAPDAIDSAMTALLEDAAQAGRTVIAGDGLVAWLDGEQAEELGEGSPPPVPAASLAEAQLDAIEVAFADQDRKLSRLRRELADLRDRSHAAANAELEVRLQTIEARLDQQDAALRHVLEQLIDFFEEGRG